MACAAPGPGNFWNRAVICDIPCETMVEVFYVDIGIKMILNINQIRKMQQKYMSFATQVSLSLQLVSTNLNYFLCIIIENKHFFIQAIQVNLKDIAPSPSENEKWSLSTINYLKSYLNDFKLKAFPFSENKSTSFCKSYSVYLYTPDETNVNTFLVGMGKAVGTGAR